MIYHRIKKELSRIQKEIKKTEKQLKTLPSGKIIVCHNNKYYKTYQSDGHTRSLITKDNRAYAEELARKKYLTYYLKDLINEERAIQFYLRHHKESDNKAEKLLTDYPGYRDLLSPYFQTKSKTIKNWLEEPFEPNPNYPENLKHSTIAGVKVRSKSEALIISSLYNHRIPFRYECPLTLNGLDGYSEYTIHPDFTLLHPKTLEVFYWEHFGLMDKQDYMAKTCDKLQRYAANGIYPSVNLIMTWESEEHPLSVEMIEKLIEYYFL